MNTGLITLTDTNMAGENLLHIAAREGYLDMVQFLLAAVSLQDRHSKSKSSARVVWADIDCRTRGGRTALLYSLAPASHTRKADRTAADFNPKRCLAAEVGEVRTS